jgi:hypothetical protein
MVQVMAEAARISLRSGGNEDDVQLSGFHLYGFSKLHPASAAAA